MSAALILLMGLAAPAVGQETTSGPGAAVGDLKPDVPAASAVAEDVQRLIERLSEGPRVRFGPCGNAVYGSPVAWRLKAVGPVAVPFLVQALAHENENVRAGAALALGLFGNPGVTVPDSAYWKPDSRPRPRVCPEAREALPALTEALKDPSAAVRVNAALAVWRLGGDKDAVLPIIESARSDSDSNVRGGAVEALYRMGEVSGSLSGLIRQASGNGSGGCGH